MPVNPLEKRVAELEKKLKALEGVIKASPTGLEINAAATVKIKAGAMLDLQGAVIKLNNGGQPLVRVGDVGAPTPGGPIVGPGNPTVLG